MSISLVAIQQELKRLYPQMLEDYRRLMMIPSKKSAPLPAAPFGAACAQVLQAASDICRREGLITGNVDNYMVYGQYGTGEEYVGMFGHLDVVEEGVGWDRPPYAAVIENNRMYGRGALDSKGPSIAALYALIALKNLKMQPLRPIRMIFGANEESGMADMDYYLQHCKAPVMGFVPDNKFPAIYGERGRAVIQISGPVKEFNDFFNNYLLRLDGSGKTLGIACSDEHFGNLIVRGVKLVEVNGKTAVNFSLSTPVCDIKSILSKLKSTAGNLTVELLSFTEWALKNPNSSNVQALQAAYMEVMHDSATITTTTGMTYAHKCQSVIPFGPSFPGQNGIAHLPNEWFDLDDLMKCSEIYAYGLAKLNEVTEIIPS